MAAVVPETETTGFVIAVTFPTARLHIAGESLTVCVCLCVQVVWLEVCASFKVCPPVTISGLLSLLKVSREGKGMFPPAGND